MLPTTRVNGVPAASPSARSHHHQLATYLRRLSKPNQMDFEYAACELYILLSTLWVYTNLPSVHRYTFWLMLQLCYSPKTAYVDDGCALCIVCVHTRSNHPCRYRHSTYNKQTKNYWARDDPAFVVVCCQLVALAALAYSFMCVSCGCRIGVHHGAFHHLCGHLYMVSITTPSHP